MCSLLPFEGNAVRAIIAQLSDRPRAPLPRSAWLHLKRIVEIGRDIGSNLSSWNAERSAGELCERVGERAGCVPLVVAAA